MNEIRNDPAAALDADTAARIDAFWRACNYLAAGMIYLRDNPLLEEPLRPEHIKQRLLGHWGASVRRKVPSTLPTGEVSTAKAYWNAGSSVVGRSSTSFWQIREKSWKNANWSSSERALRA